METCLVAKAAFFDHFAVPVDYRVVVHLVAKSIPIVSTSICFDVLLSFFS